MLRLLVGLLSLGTAARLPAADPVSAVGTADAVEFKVGDAVFTRYHVGPAVAKPYFYPVVAPNGSPVTRAWPMEKGKPGETTDHVHQKSVWFCHGDVIPEGVELKTKSGNKHVAGVNFWDEVTGHGTMVCVEVGKPKQVASNHVAVPTRNEWRTPDGQKILDETRTVHVLTLPAGRLIVLDVDLHASVCPITFGDTKEGAMGVRVNDDIRAAKGKEPGAGTLLGANGKIGEKDVWGYDNPWVDYSGPIAGKTAGVAVFDGPANAHKPAWHARGYGLLAANPFGRAGSGFPARKGQTELVKLAKGNHLTLRYGVYAHDGDAQAGQVAEAYKAFAAMK